MEFNIAVVTLDILEITGKDILHCSVLYSRECSVILPVKRIFFSKDSILTENQLWRDMKRHQEKTQVRLSYLLNEDQGIRSCAG